MRLEVVVCCGVVWLAVAAASDEQRLVEALWGRHGLNRAATCGRAPSARCDAALWTPRWALVRASCLPHQYPLYLVRASDGLSCPDIHAGIAKAYNVRHVTSKIDRPLGQPQPYDLAVLQVDPPYTGIDTFGNFTSLDYMLKPFIPIVNAQKLTKIGISRAQKMAIFSTPLRMFITTVLLPTFTFMAFFLFIIFCTGQQESNPYKSLEKCDDIAA